MSGTTDSARLRQIITDLNNSDFGLFHNDQLTSCKYYDCQEFLSTFSSSKFTFSSLHLNISSLGRHFDELNALLALLNFKFGIIGITESRFVKGSPPSCNFIIDGYSVEHTPTESSAGGALLYISNHYAYKPRSDLDQIVYSPSELESVFVEISFTHRSNIVVGCIYRHPGMSVNAFNNEHLSPLLQTLSKENKSIILLGDFNINLLKCDENLDVSNFLDILGSQLLIPQITLPTRVTRDSKTLIDNIFSSVPVHQSFSGNLLHSISDHLPQFFCESFVYDDDSGESIPCYYPDWSNFKQEEFINTFRDLSWNEVLRLDSQDVNFSMETLISTVNSLVDRHLPTRKLTKKQLNKKPWITSGIVKSISRRDFFLRKFVNAKTIDSRNFYHGQFKRYRNQIVTLCRRSKINYFSNFFQRHTQNTRKIWQGVRNIISLKSSSSAKPISLEIDGIVTSDPFQVANSFNSFFSSVAESVRSTIPESDKHFSEFLRNQNPNSLFLSLVTVDEVFKLIQSLSPSKSSGPNSIPTNILKLISAEISNPLSDLINLSFQTGVFPSILKLSKVIPVFKKGSALQPSNYRPISLLSNIDKIFEKLVHKRLSSFLEVSNIVYNRQFGFRKGHSTEHALLSMIERIQKTLDKGQVAVGVFVDLQKAFDTVDHDILLSKLQHYGIRGITNQWFYSYLSNRTQLVSVGNSSSDIKSVDYGVPQGSVLGPLLFLIYLNDLHYALHFSEVEHFADDTNLFQFGNSPEILGDRLTLDLQSLTSWLNANKISINSSKTEYIIFSSRFKQAPDLQILLNGQRLNPSSYLKYLGVYVDEHLSWKPHVSELCSKLRRANGALSRVRHYVSPKILLNIYHAIFGSHLRYGCQLWAQNSNTTTRRAFILQKYALRLISFSAPRSPSTPLFSHYKILTIFDTVIVLNILFIHKFLNSSLPSDLCDTFNFQYIDHIYPTRNRILGLLKMPIVRTTNYGLQSLCHQAVSQWNSLQQLNPSQPFSEMSLISLKTLVTCYLLNQY